MNYKKYRNKKVLIVLSVALALLLFASPQVITANYSDDTEDPSPTPVHITADGETGPTETGEATPTPSGDLAQQSTGSPETPTPSAGSDTPEPTGGEQSSEPTDDGASDGEYSVRFIIDPNKQDVASFEGGGSEDVEQVAAEQTLEGIIPEVVVKDEGDDSAQLQGWEDVTQGSENSGTIYTTDELESNQLTGDSTFMALFRSGGMGLMSFGVPTIPETINGIIQSAHQGKICVYPALESTTDDYDVFDATEDGLKQALYLLYSKGSGSSDYVLYIGANVTSSTNDTHVGCLGAQAPASHTQMTFSALKDRVRTLYLIGHSADSTDSTTTQVTGASILTLSSAQPIYAGCNMVFRNITYSLGTIYMDGYSLDLARGAYMNSTSAMNIYGGMPSGDTAVRGDKSQINISSGGASRYHKVVAGNEAGTFTGDVELNINHMSTSTYSSNTFTLYGGSISATHSGNTAINIGDGINPLGAITTATIFGGNASGEHEGNVCLEVLGTNTGSSSSSFNLYGGNEQGKHTGDFTAYIATIGNIGSANLVGGNKEGEFNGEVDMDITTAGQASSLTVYGGSEGKLGTTRVDNAYIYEGTHNGSSNVYIGDTGTATRAVIIGASKVGDFVGNADITVGYTSARMSLSGGIGETGSVTGNVSATLLDTANTSNMLTIRGGGFSDTYKPIYIDGNVSTTVENMRCSLAEYYGGLVNGNISGGIRNKLITSENSGARFNDAPLMFYGGSDKGNIGTKGETVDAIYTEIDTRGFTGNTNSMRYTGANKTSGIIHGKITNHVTAGTYSHGSINGFNGAGATDTRNPSNTNVNNITIDSVTQKRTINSENIKALSAFQVFGDIENHMYQGCFSSGASIGYSRGAGFGGYIEGNVNTYVGEHGLAYGDNYYMEITEDSFNTVERKRGSRTGWDIVAGGGGTGRAHADDIYIKGNCSLIQYYTLARWTYGGGFGGVIEGNTHNELYFGIVDTLEGGGYATHLIKGNTSAYIHNGQIDYFLTGGAWDDATIDGNTSLIVDDGMINGSLSGYYGNQSDCLLTGNTEILIRGGDHSGLPDGGRNAFTGGMARQGTILGNIRMTLDFRTPDGKPDTSKRPFKLPSQMFICGGRPFGSDFSSEQNWNLGASADNWIELNIYSNTGEDVLAGAYIYGDGGGGRSDRVNTVVTDANALANCKSGKITINIDAPGATIGTLYATSYKIGSASGIQKDVTINLVDAAEVGGLNGGCIGDEFTNAIANANPNNKASINVGYYTDPEDPRWEKENDTIKVGSNGFNNFTHLNVSNKLLMVHNDTISGSIRNGSTATAATHQANFGQFGHTLLEHNGGIGITGSTIAPIISIGNLTIKGETRLVSPSGEGRVLLTDFEALPDDEGTPALLEWTKNDVGTTVNSTGTWFGARPAYRVLTFTDGGNNAQAMTPLNFVGINEADGKTYIGDNDITTTPKYAIAIPGSFLDVDAENIDEADGWVKHDVPNVSSGYNEQGQLSLPIEVYGNVKANTPVKQFRLAIPAPLTGEDPILPTVTFIPERDDTESWIKEIEITSTKIGEDVEVRPERADGHEDTWTSPSEEYSYTIEVLFTNQAEISSRNIILTQQQAFDTLENVNNVLDTIEAKGRPFFGHDIDEEMIARIVGEIGKGERMRVHEVRLRAGVVRGGVPTQNYMEETAYIVIVPNADVAISDDKHTAISAYDSSMTVTQADEDVQTQADLDTGFTKAMLIHSDGTSGSPDINSTAISDIKAVLYTTTVPVTYSHTRDGDTDPAVSLQVDVLVLDNYVCKIDNTGYLTLGDAIESANSMSDSKDIIIKMLVDEYNREGALLINGRKVTITTGAKTDAIMPYKGKNEKATITFGPGADTVENLLSANSSSKLVLTAITLDGTGLSGNDAPTTFIKLDGSSSLIISTGAEIQNFTTTGPLISSPYSLEINGGLVQGNSSQSETGLIYANRSLVLQDAAIKNNTAVNGGGVYADSSCVIQANNTEISGNTVSGEGGGIYHGGSRLSINGKIYIYDNIKKNTQHPDGVRNNIYLAETSTGTPYKKVIEIPGTISEGSSIGVQTEKSGSNAGKGVLYTVVAVPAGGYTGIADAAQYFAHDQLEINAKAYQVIMDQRPDAKNLILGYNNAVDFSFTKVDARDTTSALPDAEFMLYRCDNPEHIANDLHVEMVTQDLLNDGGCWQPVLDDTDTTKQVIFKSDSEGLVDFGMLENGSYMLVEIEAPAGFTRPVGQWKLKIDNTKPLAQRVSITGLGHMLPPAFARNVVNNDHEEFLLPNMPAFALNTTGDIGVYPIIAAGAALMLTAVALFIWTKRKSARTGSN